MIFQTNIDDTSNLPSAISLLNKSKRYMEIRCSCRNKMFVHPNKALVSVEQAIHMSIYSLKQLYFFAEWTHLIYVLGLCFFRDNLAVYARDYQIKFILGYCSIYIFMQTFMIPGTIFMSLLAGSLYGVVRGVLLVVFTATAGASSCYFLSKLIGRPLVGWLWPEKLRFFQSEVSFELYSEMINFHFFEFFHFFSFLKLLTALACITFDKSYVCAQFLFFVWTQVAKRKEKLLNYLLFLRITPSLPNTFINVASPIVDIPFHVFFAATLVGLIPASYITVRVSFLFLLYSS